MRDSSDRHIEPDARWRVRRWILRGLAATHAIAFVSLLVQLRGLIGDHGILPAELTLVAWRSHFGSAAPRLLPTLFWWLGTSDAMLIFACAAGIALAALLWIGVAPSLALFGLWLLYLSLSCVGGVFLSYQWDALLLEASLGAIWLAAGQWRPRDASRVRVPALAFWLLRLLLLRLMWCSGFEKLASGDPTWSGLEALEFHFFTQPLPAWTSVFAHELPRPLLRLLTALTLAIELGLPIVALGPRPARRLACCGFLALQLLIGLTGNYGFFNLLTCVLCLSLLDDRDLDLAALMLRLRPATPPAANAPRRPSPWLAPTQNALIAALFALSLTRFAGQLFPEAIPGPLRSLLDAGARLRSSNRYGLFAVMTTERPEIELEISSDGQAWQALVLRFKPGPLDRWPRFAQPHMPRLDWQLWFAALQGCERAPWFQSFAEQLLRGSRPVWSLIGEAPPELPPQLLRSTLYRYRLASAERRRATGQIWERTRLGPFCPVVQLVRGAAAD